MLADRHLVEGKSSGRNAGDAQPADTLLVPSRAELDALSRQLELTLAAAMAAEQAARTADPEEVLELVKRSLATHVAARRQALTDELVRARADAVARVETAQREAAAIVAAAAGQVVGALLQGPPKLEDAAAQSRPAVDAASSGIQPLSTPEPAPFGDPPTAIPPAPRAHAVSQRPPRHGIRRFVHLDTVLPLVAVLILLVVLVAWIG